MEPWGCVPSRPRVFGAGDSRKDTGSAPRFPTRWALPGPWGRGVAHSVQAHSPGPSRASRSFPRPGQRAMHPSPQPRPKAGAVPPQLLREPRRSSPGSSPHRSPVSAKLCPARWAPGQLSRGSLIMLPISAYSQRCKCSLQEARPRCHIQI